MGEIKWTERALLDLQDIGEYISNDSPRYASLSLEKIIETAELIEDNPLIGRIVPEININEIREIITGNYRIIYQISNSDLINILTIHHTSRLLSNNPFFQ
jgi:addiction module RelE/StbE family toxin